MTNKQRMYRVLVASTFIGTAAQIAKELDAYLKDGPDE